MPGTSTHIRDSYPTSGTHTASKGEVCCTLIVYWTKGINADTCGQEIQRDASLRQPKKKEVF